MQKRAKAMTTLRSNACVDDCTKMDFESRATHTVKLWSPPTHTYEFFGDEPRHGLGQVKQQYRDCIQKNSVKALWDYGYRTLQIELVHV